jgi:glycerol-3-phosphate acyltransferase PlsY
MEQILKLSLIILFSYLIGSFPTAIVISKRFFGFDIREKGSGNMGSTNAFRTLGWKWGIVVQVVDIIKGLLAVIVVANLLGRNITFDTDMYFNNITIVRFIAGLSAVIGHIFSIFVGFRGGKGVNTAAGMLIGIAPVDVSIAIGFFILAVILSGYISLGSLVAALVLPSSIIFRYNVLHDNIPGYDTLIILALVVTLLLFYAHRKNVIRLVKGTENRFPKLHLIKVKFLMPKAK